MGNTISVGNFRIDLLNQLARCGSLLKSVTVAVIPTITVIRNCFICLGTFLVALVLFANISSASTHNTGHLCNKFVEELIADDYRQLLAVEYVSSDILSDCETAYKANKNNPIYMFGLAKFLETFAKTRGVLARAVELHRKAAEQSYEPAIFQLLRYRWREFTLHDSLLSKRYLLNFTINDDYLPYVDRLKSSKSRTVRDFVLGMLVHHYKRPQLAKQLAMKNVKEGSTRALFYLGMMQLGGLGVERNRKQGLATIGKAAKLGDLEAQATILTLTALTYNDGPDTKEIDAFKAAANAANRGSKYASFQIIGKIKLLMEKGNIVDQKDWDKRQPYRNALLQVLACNLSDISKGKIFHQKSLLVCNR